MQQDLSTFCDVTRWTPVKIMRENNESFESVGQLTWYENCLLYNWSITKIMKISILAVYSLSKMGIPCFPFFLNAVEIWRFPTSISRYSQPCDVIKSLTSANPIFGLIMEVLHNLESFELFQSISFHICRQFNGIIIFLVIFIIVS